MTVAITPAILRLAPYLLAFAFLMAPALMRPAQSQTLCGPTADILAQVTGKFAETPFAYGAIGPARLAKMIFFTNEKTGTWTVIVIHTKGGAACVLAAGHGFKPAMPARPAGKDI